MNTLDKLALVFTFLPIMPVCNVSFSGMRRSSPAGAAAQLGAGSSSTSEETSHTFCLSCAYVRFCFISFPVTFP